MTAAGTRLDRPLFLPSEASTLFAVVSEPVSLVCQPALDNQGRTYRLNMLLAIRNPVNSVQF